MTALLVIGCLAGMVPLLALAFAASATGEQIRAQNREVERQRQEHAEWRARRRRESPGWGDR